MLQVVDNYIMIHDVSHKHHDTYHIVRKLAILKPMMGSPYELASSNTTSCLIICLLNVRNLIKTIHNLYTMSFWKHILSQKHQLTKELPCTGDQSALIVWSCFPYHSSLTACTYPIIPLPPGRGVGPPDQCRSLYPTKTSPDPDPVKTDIKYREILFDGLTCTKYLQHCNQYLLFPVTLMSLK